MSAYSRGELSVEAYLVRIIAGLCRQNGGELRVKGEIVDTVGEPTALLKEWDSKTQEIVLRTGVGSFTEVFKVIPERQVRQTIPVPPATPRREVFDPLQKIFKDEGFAKPNGADGVAEFLPHNSTLDDERATRLEHDQKIKRAAALIREELNRRRRQPQGELG